MPGMRPARPTGPAALLLLLALACAAPAPAPTRDPSALAGPPPAAGSDGAKADLAIVLWEQQTRTAEDVRRAQAGVKLGLAAFAEALGPAFDPARHPRTEALLAEVGEECRKATGELKLQFLRPRPFVADPRVQPAIEREASPSYPSGHAARGVVFARLLAELAPERREALRLRGLGIGFDRVIGGVHWPSDVEASQRLAPAVADRLLAEPAWRARLEAVRAAEWAGR